MILHIIDKLITILGFIACFYIGWRLSGTANRDRIEIVYPKEKVEKPVFNSPIYRTEADLAEFEKETRIADK